MIGSPVSRQQRHTRANPCGVCGGYDTIPQGKGERCYGFDSADGLYIHCTREEYGGRLHTDGTHLHIIGTSCECGQAHGPTRIAPRARPVSPARAKRAPMRDPGPAERSAMSHGSPPAEEEPKGWTLAATYDYRSAAGTLLAQKLRYEDHSQRTRKGKPKKRFVWRRPMTSGGWDYDRRGVDPVLYRLPEVQLADPAELVYLVEGEKVCDLVRGLHLVATTGPDGARKWTPAFTEALRGRHVLICPDHDADGAAHLDLVAESLAGAATSVRVLTLEQLLPSDAGPVREGADIGDWIQEQLAAGTAREDIRATLDTAARAARPYADYRDQQAATNPDNMASEPQTITRNGLRLLHPGTTVPSSAVELMEAGRALELGEGSRLYYIASETAAGLAGIWARTQNGARCLLSMAARVVAVAASAPREGLRSSNLYTLELTSRDGAEQQTVYADPESFKDGSVWASLAGLAVSYPQSTADCDKARDAVAALATLEHAPRVSLVPALGYQLDPQTGAPVWVRVDGVVTADGILRHPFASVRADVPADWPQRLPEPGEEATKADAQLLLELLRDFWPGERTCFPVAALGTVSRVRLPGYGTQPGRIDWQPELYRWSGAGKTTFVNELLCLQGSGYTYNTPTQLTQQEEGLARDTAIGANQARARLAYHCYLDMDYNASPDSPDWDSQQQHRKALLASDGNLTSGGLIGSRGGGMRQRPRPSGGLIRTGEVPPNPYSVARGEEGTTARACTFVLPEGLTFDRAVSERVDTHRGALVALGLAYDQWLLRQGAEGIRVKAAGLREQLRQQIRDQAGQIGSGWHPRTVSQLEDMGLGLAVFTAFLREDRPAGAEQLAEWIGCQWLRLIVERLANAQRLATEYIAHRGGIGSMEQLAEWICNTLRGALKRGKAHVTDPRGHSIAPPPPGQGGTWRDTLEYPHLPEGLSPADLGYSERVADDGYWSARGVRLGASDGLQLAFLLWSKDVYDLLQEAARQQRRSLPSAVHCWLALEQTGNLRSSMEGDSSHRGTIVTWDSEKQRAVRALCIPWAALFPEIDPDPGSGKHTDGHIRETEGTTEDLQPDVSAVDHRPEDNHTAVLQQQEPLTGQELLAVLPAPLPAMTDWKRAAHLYQVNGCQPVRIWTTKGWQDLSGAALFKELGRHVQSTRQQEHLYAYAVLDWLIGRTDAAPEAPGRPQHTQAAAAPRKSMQPVAKTPTPSRSNQAAAKDTTAEDVLADSSTPAVWLPAKWVREPRRANRLGVVCGGYLYIWGTPDPQTSGGLVPVAAETINLLEPDQSGQCPAEDMATLAALQRHYKLRALWLVPLEGERPGPNDSPVVQNWERLAQPTVLGRRTPEVEWYGIATRGQGNVSAYAGLCHNLRSAEGRAEQEAHKGTIHRIHAPWVQDAWGVDGTLSGLGDSAAVRARVFASALLLAERALDMQWQFSASLTGLFILRETLQHWSAHEVDVSPLPEEWQEKLAAVRTSDVRWARGVPAEELAGLGVDLAGSAPVWVYDRNFSFVSSAREVPCGIPQEVTEYRPDMPMGVYLCDAAAPADWDPRTPGLIRSGEEGEAGTYPLEVHGAWVWTPYLQLAREAGWRVNITQGYAWPRAQVHEVLRSWQGRVWEARRICEQYKARPGMAGAAGAVAVRLVKRLGVATIGRLMPRAGHTLMDTAQAEAEDLPIEWEEVDSSGQFTGLAEVRVPLGRADLVHPEWWSPIIARAGSRLLAAVQKYAPLHTAGMYIDCLYSLRRCPDLEGDPLKIGGYRLKSHVQLAAALLQSGNFSELVNMAAEAERTQPHTAKDGK